MAREVNARINYFIEALGSKEKVEEYFRKSLPDIREQYMDIIRNQYIVQQVRSNLTKDVKVTPSDVRKYYDNLDKDSVPFIPMQVEVQIITRTPKVETAEINRIKDELREYTDRVTKGETSFATLARLYSEDPGTARLGGEFDDYVGRGMLDPAFANVAFNLTDPKKISKIVETEFGFHIIQLIDKRGDKIKVRHILRKPSITKEAINKASMQLDSIAMDIRAGKFTFEEAATYISDDKDTRNNNGLMANSTEEGRTSKFQMRNLPTEVARVVDTLKVGQVSAPFKMISEKNGKTLCAIVKLKSRVETHRATITEDFQAMRDIVLAKRKEEFVKEWIKDKIKKTYIRINDRYKNCNFEYQGWVK